MEENSKSLVSAVSFGVGVGLEFEDQRSVEDALEGVKRLANLSYIMVIDSRKELFYEHGKTNAASVNYKNWATETDSFVDKGLLNVASPIIGSSNRQIGTLLLGLNTDSLLILKKKNQMQGLGLSLAIFLISLIGALVLAFNISRPIDKIIYMIQEINSGNLSTRNKQWQPVLSPKNEER
jgi:methyl-accepting chemotaxis protein